MKATLLKSVVCVTFVLAGVFNTNLNAGNKFATNDEMKDGKVVSKEIYINDNGLTRHMKYNYEYNESGNITDKEALKWNKEKESWVPYYKISYTYSRSKLVLEFARWNPIDKAYNYKKEKNIYGLDNSNTPVSYTAYTWDNGSSAWAFNYKTIYTESNELSASIQ